MDRGRLLASGTLDHLRSLTGMVSLEDIFVSLAKKGGAQ